MYGSGVGRAVEEVGTRVKKDKVLQKQIQGIREKYMVLMSEGK